MSSTMKQEVSVPVPWGEIRGRVWGPDHGHPVLCLHGWADNCGSFNTLIPLLPKGFRYVAVDFPGHGRSTHRPPGMFYNLSSYVADVCRLVDDLQWTKFSIIGHSMGGNVAAEFSALYPEMVDALVLLDAFGFWPLNPEEISKSIRQSMDKMLQYEKQTQHKNRVYTYEKAVERLLAATPTLSLVSASNLLERGLAQVEGGYVFSRDFRVNFEGTVRRTLDQCLELQSRIQAPVLVLLADKGFSSIASKLHLQTLMSFELLSLVLQGWSDKYHSVVTVSGDHHVHLNNPEVVAPLVSDFMQNTVSTQQLPPESVTPGGSTHAS